MRYPGLSAALTALTLAACAAPAPIDERSAAREEARRELERECRIAAMQRREDPRCPQPESYGQPPQTRPLELPPPTPPPPVSLPEEED